MIQNQKILAVIPARGGSKGVHRKNIRNLAGKPLIAWTIEEAKKSKYIDRFILSSEDLEIIEVAKKYGCEVPFVRPEKFANDNTPGIEPVLHAINEIPNFDIVLVLQPTSPLRTVSDIDDGLFFFINIKAPVCVSIAEVKKPPHWMFYLKQDNKLVPVIAQEKRITRRQDLPKAFLPNGALFIGYVTYLREQKTFYTQKTVGFLMPKERSFDIDEEEDFLYCEKIIENLNTK